jgi:hypothetical protein
VTLIIGIICKDGIVIASESQSTDEGRIKHCNTQKIFNIRLSDQSSALIAGAGSTDLVAETAKAMERIAKDKRLNDYRAIGDIAAQACRETRENQERWFCGTPAELKEHLSGNSFWLMIAHFYKKQPYVFILESGKRSVVWPRSQSYFILGNSEVVADYILRRFSFSEMGIIDTTIAAIYTVNEVCGIDSTCSGKIQAGTIQHSGNGSLRRPVSFARLWSSNWIENIRSEFEERADEINTEAIKQMKSVFKEVSKQIFPDGELNPDYEEQLSPTTRANALSKAIVRMKE